MITKLDAGKIDIHKESPALNDFIKKYAKDITGNIVPNALDFIRMNSLFIPIIFHYETKSYIFVKEFHKDLIYTLSQWLGKKIVLKDTIIDDPEYVLQASYYRRVSECYIQTDVIVHVSNTAEVNYLIDLYKQM